MRVRELMTGAPVTVSPATSMLDARHLMLSKHFRHLLVTKDGQLVGIVTDRDVRLNLPSQATSLSVWEINHLLTKLTVGEVMTRGRDHRGARPRRRRRGAPHDGAQDRRAPGDGRRSS